MTSQENVPTHFMPLVIIPVQGNVFNFKLPLMFLKFLNNNFKCHYHWCNHLVSTCANLQSFSKTQGFLNQIQCNNQHVCMLSIQIHPWPFITNHLTKLNSIWHHTNDAYTQNIQQTIRKKINYSIPILEMCNVPNALVLTLTNTKTKN